MMSGIKFQVRFVGRKSGWNGQLFGGLTWHKGRFVVFYNANEISGQRVGTEIWMEGSVMRWV